METVQVNRSDGVSTYLQNQAAKHGCASAREYLQSVLDALDRNVKEKQAFEGSLLEAIGSPRVVADAAFWEERRRKILDKHPELK